MPKKYASVHVKQGRGVLEQFLIQHFIWKYVLLDNSSKESPVYSHWSQLYCTFSTLVHTGSVSALQNASADVRLLYVLNIAIISSALLLWQVYHHFRGFLDLYDKKHLQTKFEVEPWIQTDAFLVALASVFLLYSV